MLALVVLGYCCIAQADPVKQPESDRRVAQLVRQLDDDQWSRRENAEQALMQMGPDILQVLPDNLAGMSPEAEKRLQNVRTRLQVARGKEAVKASRVTLRGTMTLADALARLQKSTGNGVVGYAEYGDRQVSVDLDQAPFWEVLDRLLDQADLTVYPYDDDDTAVRLVQRDPNQVDRSGRAHYEGVFRIQPTYVSAARDLLNASIKGLRVRL